MNQLFTSDWHVDHYNVIKYCDRPFNTLDEMCDEFFSKLKEMWKRGSTLHVIGDMALRKPGVEMALDRLKEIGVNNVVYLFGNHDGRTNSVRRVVQDSRIVSWCGDVKTIKVHHGNPLICADPMPCFLFHYPTRSWNMSSHGSRHLHGHSHGNMLEWFNSLDVSIDNAKKLLGEYRPFTASEIIHCIQEINTRSAPNGRV